jgi:hypothetical protein
VAQFEVLRVCGHLLRGTEENHTRNLSEDVPGAAKVCSGHLPNMPEVLPLEQTYRC